jgi:hypothetical protein
MCVAMEKKSHFIFIVALIYVVLCCTIFYFNKESKVCDDSADDEDIDTLCVRFCEVDESKLTNREIRDGFHLNYTKLVGWFENFRISRGKPNCLFTKIYDNKSVENFDEGEYSYLGENFYFTPSRYCLSKIDVNQNIEWEMIICNDHEFLSKFVDFFGKKDKFK